MFLSQIIKSIYMNNENLNPAELRSQAITWWNELTEEQRDTYYNGYKQWTPASSSRGLTGREVQNIWAVAMNPPEPTPSNEFESEIFNDTNPTTFTLAEVRDIVNGFSKTIGFWDYIKRSKYAERIRKNAKNSNNSTKLIGGVLSNNNEA